MKAEKVKRKAAQRRLPHQVYWQFRDYLSKKSTGFIYEPLPTFRQVLEQRLRRAIPLCYPEKTIAN